MKYKLPLFILLLVLPFTLTACSIADVPLIGSLFGPKAPSNQPVTLNFWGLWESPEVMNAMITKYKETHPNVTINYDDRSVLNPNDYKERVFSRITQADGIDIITVHNSWVPRLTPALVPASDEVITAANYATLYYPSASEAAIAEGKVYAMPAGYDGLVLLYNKKHFEDISQLEPPTAWEEFRRLALELTVRGDNNKIVRAGAAIGTANNNVFYSDILGLMFAQAGVSFPEDLDSRAAQDALLFYTNFSKEDKVWDDSFIEASAAFTQGQVSMIFVPTWAVLDILNAKPNMSIGVAPVPQALPESPVSWGSFWMYVVPKTSTNSAAAWDFINFLNKEEQQLALYSQSAQLRQFGTAYSLVSLAPQLSANSYLAPVLASAPYSKVSELAARSGNKKQVDALKEAVNSLVTARSGETASPATALKAAKDALSAPKAPTQ